MRDRLSERLREQTRALATGEPVAPRLARKPDTRAGCADVPRPCPFLSCRHHLALEVSPHGNLSAPIEVWSEGLLRGPSCALDVAEDGEHSRDEIALLLRVSKETVRTEELIAMLHVRAALDHLPARPRCRLCGGRSVGWLAACRQHLAPFARSAAAEAAIGQQVGLVAAWDAWVECQPSDEGDD